jgi:hypothetical protein
MDVYYIDSCNCSWGCPCQFNSKPTYGNCEGIGGILIKKGNYGTVNLDGLAFAMVLSYPGAVHEGNGRGSYYIDDRASEEQFRALSLIVARDSGGGPFGIYSRTCSEIQRPKRAKFNYFEGGLTSRFEIENFAKVELEPMSNPVTHEEFRAIIELPSGFEASRMEQASSKMLRVDDGFVKFEYANTYGSVSKASWSGQV